MVISTVSEEQRAPSGVLLAEVSTGDLDQWACEDERVIEVGAGWGKVEEIPLVVARSLSEHVPTTLIDLSAEI